MIDFQTFMSRVANVIATTTDGMTHDDFADACWYDLYSDTDGAATDEEIRDCLADADDLFAAWLETTS